MNELLTHEETLALLRRAKQGDEKAKETLVVKNIALVKSIVKGYLKRGAEYDDLMQIGAMGLIKAIDGFDTAYDVKFSTYAVPMIAGEIKRFLRDDGMIKVSRSLKENAVKIFRATEKLKKNLNREPDIGEIAEETGIEREEIVNSLEAVREPVSIYEPIFENRDGKAELLDTLAVEDDNSMIDRLMVSELLSRLEEREKKIIQLRFFDDKTQGEIAKIIGISQVQVSRLLVRTLEKLRKAAE